MDSMKTKNTNEKDHGKTPELSKNFHAKGKQNKIRCKSEKLICRGVNLN